MDLKIKIIAGALIFSLVVGGTVPDFSGTVQAQEALTESNQNNDASDDAKSLPSVSMPSEQELTETQNTDLESIESGLDYTEGEEEVITEQTLETDLKLQEQEASKTEPEGPSFFTTPQVVQAGFTLKGFDLGQVELDVNQAGTYYYAVVPVGSPAISSQDLLSQDFAGIEALLTKGMGTTTLGEKIVIEIGNLDNRVDYLFYFVFQNQSSQTSTVTTLYLTEHNVAAYSQEMTAYLNQEYFLYGNLIYTLYRMDDDTNPEIFAAVVGINGTVAPSSITVPSVVSYGETFYNVRVIDNSAFASQSSITSMTLPSTLRYILPNAFAGCARLQSIVIPNQVLYIGDGAFMGCTSLISVSLPASLKEIAPYLFFDCKNLTSIVIPGLVNRIGVQAFTNCARLTNPSFPDSILEIGYAAFMNCDNLTTIILPKNLNILEDLAFTQCDSLTGISIASQNPTMSSQNGVLFDKNKTTLVLYPAGKAGSYTVPTTVITIGASSFQESSKITGVSIPSSTRIIDRSAFNGCINLQTVNMVNGVHTISAAAFMNCKKLVSFTMPNSVTTLGGGAFDSCTALKTITLSTQLTEIRMSTFNFCSSLLSLTIPNGVISIAQEAIANCSSLKTISIPASVRALEPRALSNCASLESILVAAGNLYFTSVQGVLFNKSKNTLIQYPSGKAGNYTIPNGVTYIGDDSFSGSKKLTGISIPNGVKDIGHSAFLDCTSLKTVRFPASVKNIWSDAFRNCSNLLYLVFDGDACPNIVGEGVFKTGNYQNLILTIVCPPNAISGYQRAFNKLVSSASAYSPSLKIVEFVTRFYDQVLTRQPDNAGLANWVGQLSKQTLTGADLANGFLDSNELKTRNLKDNDYVELLYKTILGRNSDPQGKSNWLYYLQNGATRKYISDQFFQSNEFTQLCKSYGINRGKLIFSDPLDMNIGATMFVFRLYDRALGRRPDLEGHRNWVGALIHRQQTPEQVAEGFFGSQEFIGKRHSNENYSRILYRTFLDREADTHGLNDWVGQLNRGGSRSAVLRGFSQSPEFKNIMSRHGL